MPFAWLRERDIDLLICSELHVNGALTRFVAHKVAASFATFTAAWVSHAEIDGESDLVVAFSHIGECIVVLIENKIAASFQPDQAERYSARARRWASVEGVARVVTVLLAPADYMRRPGAEAFDERISYEEVATVLRADGDARSIFLADALGAGVDAFRRGYVMNPDESVSDMWIACWRISQAVAPKLHFQQPGLKPSLSTWFYFKDADGFSKDRSRAVVVFKAERGQVDLQFAETTRDALERRAESIIDATMTVEAAGKSASIRLPVPSIDFQGTAEGQEAAIIDGFKACERMRAFFVEHRSRLLEG